MFNKDGASGQRCHQVDVAVVKKVVVLASETCVWLLFDFKDDVASVNAGGTVTLAFEFDAGAALHTSVDVDVENLSVDNCFLAVALLATIFVLDNLSFTVAVGASSLEALDHGAHLSHHGLHTVTIAACAALDGALLSSTTLTLGADDGSLKRQLGNLSSIDVFQGNLVCVVNSASLRRTAGLTATAEHASEAAEATAAKELGEQIFGGHATTTAAALETRLACLVIDISLLRVGQHFVGVGNFLEFVLSLLVAGVLVYKNVRYCQ